MLRFAFLAVCLVGGLGLAEETLRVSDSYLVGLIDPAFPTPDLDCEMPSLNCDRSETENALVCRYVELRAIDGPKIANYRLRIPLAGSSIHLAKTQSGERCLTLTGQIVETIKQRAARQDFETAKQEGCYEFDFWSAEERKALPQPAYQEFASLE